MSNKKLAKFLENPENLFSSKKFMVNHASKNEDEENNLDPKVDYDILSDSHDKNLAFKYNFTFNENINFSQIQEKKEEICDLNVDNNFISIHRTSLNKKTKEFHIKLSNCIQILYSKPNPNWKKTYINILSNNLKLSCIYYYISNSNWLLVHINDNKDLQLIYEKIMNLKEECVDVSFECHVINRYKDILKSCFDSGLIEYNEIGLIKNDENSIEEANCYNDIVPQRKIFDWSRIYNSFF